MRSSIGLAAASVNVVVLLILAAACASPRVTHLTRLGTATFAFVCAWLANAAFDAARVPDWTIYMGGAVIVVSVVAVLASLQLWTQAGDVGESRQARRGDEGGGGPGRRWPDAPHQGGGANDPSWWLEFERGFALHIAERQRKARVRSG